MVTLTLLMGVSFTSCLDDGDSNPMAQMSVVARLTNTSLSKTFVLGTGMELVLSDQTATMLLEPGMYSVPIQFNMNDLQDGAEYLNATLLGTPTKIDGPAVTTTQPEADAPMYALKYEDSYSTAIAPFFFDANTLVLPAMYWFKKSEGDELKAEIKKHSFVISYGEIKEGDETLTLWVTHKINETETDVARDYYTYSNYAYDLTRVISEFKMKGNTLKKVLVKAKVNNVNNRLDGASEAEVEIDYTKIDQ